ncbi:MAG: hypothetical protein COY80_03735 [Candidatus Pacebacteria bacterium CG_4_10_14_0_8_um_filter_42_14]|nr:MAG: hypothetical protein COY80_03735 [Candidatus Pacebacteria bacterium CG_4_10_14_0_8_um_filter_42_14]
MRYNRSVPDHFVLIDSHALIYRAYHAFPALTSPEGMLVNAVFGYTRILLNAIRDLEPTYIVATFDHKGKTKRKEEYEAYKAHREAMPDDLIPQIALVKDIVTALNIPQFSLEGYEADDLIGTITAHMEKEHQTVHSSIVTGDKDMFQLVTEKTHVWLPGRGSKTQDMEYDRDAVYEKMGITVDQIIDLKSLMGDASDNIPGVKGVGQKTAIALLTAHKSLDGVYKRLDELEGGAVATDREVIKGAVRTKLLADKENAYLSQKLATIDRDVPMTFALEPCRVTQYDKQVASELLEKFGFKSLKNSLPRDDFELGVQKALF